MKAHLPILLLGGLLALGACSKPPPKSVASSAAPDFNTDIPLNEVMAHVMDPAAYQFWAGSGVSITEEGERDLSPKTEAEWKKVEDGAATVALTTNSLMLPGYARAPIADWRRHAAKVSEVAMRAKAAAERQDAKAVGEISGELDEACEACHKQFPPLAPPPA